MKLLTKQIENRLEQFPYKSQDSKGLNAKVIVKFFSPVGRGTWLITEGDKLDDGDWLLFGYCNIFEWEWGSVLLSELESIKLPLGLSIERDLHISSDATVKELCRGL